MTKQYFPLRSILPLLLSVLFSGCATGPLPFERPGAYPSGVDKKEWAMTEYGVYVARDIDYTDTLVEYKVLYDNSEYKKKLAAEYETDDKFKRYVAVYIIHEGKVECRSKANTARITQYDEKMAVLRSEHNAVYSEAADIVCRIKNRG